ncbi:GH3 auxin-responsive promoter family protein [Psychroflexus montanilacus]|uniref:GH3 auxin-responsive promoter family protein n=1 Tax=Psychroflexus montanilacus TaxID=2873598 RepID=UPI001CCE5A25|nr:GH3 auxin-responsive promoter family protein [Psychroflexus montanilacus]MBZ9652147.1 GH3 auxin-responsive promoter family protein [Psychroflexus montanilacus]
MSLKSFGAKLFAKYISSQIKSWSSRPEDIQLKVFKMLISEGRKTKFGKDHNFDKIERFKDLFENVPIQDYEELKPYVDRVVDGEEDVLWPGKPLYFAKTSGTTSGAKYIPLTKESIPYHTNAARNAILCYISETGNSSFVDGKMIFLQGSPELKKKNGIHFGRLSGIVAHFVPNYLQKNRLPSWETNSIDDWNEKIDAIVEETYDQDMTIISGIPSWVQTYFEKLYQKTGKTIGELFPNLQLFIYGGVNYEPYRSKFENLIGKSVDSIELYPASEGFFAFQDTRNEEGMLLQLDSGMFYEFIRADEFFDKNPEILTIGDVEVGINYVMVISTNAGLWRYNVGDTVMFTNTKPYRLKVSGRIKHFTSAFGEHVIAQEVEKSIITASEEFEVQINEFTVAPQINPIEGLPYHEWFVEFEKEPEDLDAFRKRVDELLQKQNAYYNDLIKGNMLRTLVITKVPKNGFQEYMKSVGKLGGQNKVPRLSNDRKIADELEKQI